MLADSSDDSGSDLNWSVLDIGGISSASESDVEGGDIPAPGEAEPALPSTSNGLSLGRGGRRRMGANATTRQTGKRRKHVPISGNSSDENNDTGDWATIADISTDVEPDRQERLGSMHTCICT